MTSTPSPPTQQPGLFDHCNHTELYQLCIRAGISVSPAEPKEQLALYLEGLAEPPPLPEEQHPIHRYRLALIAFVTDYWKSIETQITCPMRFLKTTSPRPCFGCTDQQVMACMVINRDNATRIERYLPKKED